jgi:MFS family permease
MSAGELFELIRPIVVVISILLSAWVLASARKRFSTLLAFVWAIGTLFLPLIVFPVYLSVILIWHWPARSRRWRWLLPVAYAAVLLAAVGMFVRHESSTVDVYLAEATQAKLIDDHSSAIASYRRALELENNPHIHKLLARELMQVGYLSDAISEFRLAESGGEPDDSIHFYLGLLLERIDQNGQAGLEFEKFLMTQTCQAPDRLCDSARSRLGATNERSPRGF